MYSLHFDLIHIYSVSQKVVTENFLQYFHSGHLCETVPVYCHIIAAHTYQLWSIYLNILQKNGVNFSKNRLPIVFATSSFQFHQVKLL